MRTLNMTELNHVSGGSNQPEERPPEKKKEGGSNGLAAATSAMACAAAVSRTSGNATYTNAAIASTLCVEAVRQGGSWIYVKASGIPVKSNPNPYPVGWR